MSSFVPFTSDAEFAELLRSRLGRSDWVLAYWSRERLFSRTARRRWLEPDLQRLPF